MAEGGIITEPDNTRPLSLKNTDNKLIALANIRCFEKEFGRITNKSPSGFVKHRNLLTNILDIDSAGRSFSNKFEAGSSEAKICIKNTPIMLPGGFKAAFPSVNHSWIWLVLEHRTLPTSFITLFKGLYQGASAVCQYAGVTTRIINFMSGVLQGCPA